MAGRRECKQEAEEEMTTLEDFLAKAGAAEEEEEVEAEAEAEEGLSGGVFTFDPMAMSPFPSERVVDGVVGFGNGVEVVGGRGKRRAALEPLDKAAQQRQRRMIKNRESVARSRERKQAYQVELESLAVKLEEENERLLKEKSHSRTKHASNDPRGQDINPAEPEMVFKPRLFKNMEIQKTWLPEFKERPIITGREFEKSFPLKYYKKMLAPMEALGWDGFRPLSTDVYSNLVRFFYCNLEVGNLDNIEYTIDTKVRGKDIVLNPTILSEITGIANTGDCIFISKPSQLDKYVSKKHMNEVIAKKGVIGVTQTKELKKEFRLFHRYIAHNLIPKKGHYNQVTNMDAFIIYRAAMDKPLNLNYIILKEMADVRNHSSRALPYGALLTNVFKHFRVKFCRQLNEYINKGFSITTIKRGISIDSTEGEEEGEEESSRQNMEVEGNFEDPPPQIKKTHEEPSTQVLLLKLQEEDTMHDEHPMHGGDPMQEGPPVWFMEYFGKINETMERMEQRQEQQAKYLEQIIQHQEKQERYIDRLSDLYENLYEQQIDFNQKYHDRITDVETQLKYLWFSTHPPPADYPPPPSDVPSSSHQPFLPTSTSYRPPRPPSY